MSYELQDIHFSAKHRQQYPSTDYVLFYFTYSETFVPILVPPKRVQLQSSVVAFMVAFMVALMVTWMVTWMVAFMMAFMVAHDGHSISS